MRVGVVAATTLASGVEFVEALTIVLAMGTTRGWRSTWAGVGAALVALAAHHRAGGLRAAVVAARGAAAARRRHAAADLRAAVAAQGDPARGGPEGAARRGGHVPLGGRRRRGAAGDERRLGLDWFAFVVSFKGVFLEGLEIVFIVITFGLNADSIALAVARRRDRRGDRARRRLRAAQAAGPRAREHDQVRRRPAAQHLRHVLGRRGPRAGSPPTTRACSWPGGDVALLVLLAAVVRAGLATVRLLAPRGAREVA